MTCLAYVSIDPLTASGFAEIEEAFGRAKAWDHRITRLEALIERDKGFRWHAQRWERALAHARFERGWQDKNWERRDELPELFVVRGV